jgi:hypothetical protein
LLRRDDAAIEHSARARRRIHLWEEIYRVRLPNNADHPLVPVVAKRTGLSIELIAAEQKRRIAQAAREPR